MKFEKCKCGIEKNTETTAYRNKSKMIFSANCKKCQAEYTKIWRAKNAQKIKLEKAKYFQENKEEICKKEWEKKKARKESDPEWYKNEKKKDAIRLKNDIRQNLRRRIIGRLNSIGLGIDQSKHLGIDINDFIDILIKEIKEKTTIKEFINGGWCLDHIKPIFSFENKLDAFHYTNVQVLRQEDHWAKNVSDRRKYEKTV